MYEVIAIKSELSANKQSLNGAQRTAHQVVSKPKRRWSSDRKLARFYDAIDEIAALQQPLGTDEIASRLGYAKSTYKGTISPRLRLIPWLKVIRESDGIRFEIDRELREICSARRPRPDLDGVSISVFLRRMRAEISRRKKAEQDDRAKAQWTSERVRFKFAFELLEWVEAELDRVLTDQL